MDKEALLRLLSRDEVRTYGYSIGFFIVFSFFLVFAIRPNLITAFSLQKELQELKVKNKKSEEVILQVVNYQTTMEEYRDKLPLLDQAVPSAPTVAQVVDEVRRSASDSGILIEVLSVESIDLRGSTSEENQDDQAQGAEDSASEGVQQVTARGINSFTIDINGSASINEVSTFLNKLMNQRRLKKIDSVSITQEQNGSTSIFITIYYL